MRALLTQRFPVLVVLLVTGIALLAEPGQEVELRAVAAKTLGRTVLAPSAYLVSAS